MDILNPLLGFLSGIERDPRIRSTHVSLYMALFQQWVKNKGENPIPIVSQDLMFTAKISSSATYHKTLRGLHEYGYINYNPSFNKMKRSTVDI